MSTIMVLAYERPTRTVLELHQHGREDLDLAIKERKALDERYSHDKDIEVVSLFGSDAASIARTHGRYFLTMGQLVTRLSERPDQHRRSARWWRPSRSSLTSV